MRSPGSSPDTISTIPPSTAPVSTSTRCAVENGFVEIISGLSANDHVVGSGLNRIQPGSPITTAAAGAGQRGARQ